MKRTAEFNYYYGMEADTYSFYRIPKVLFTDEFFKCLSCEAKVLYGLMLDRMSLSIKNRWLDELDRVYIIFTVEEVTELMNCSKPTAVKIIAELDTEKGIGLIEKKRLGFGKANVIFVRNFMLRDVKEEKDETESSPEIEKKESEILAKSQKSNNLTSGSKESLPHEVKKINFKESKKLTSGSKESELQEVKKVDSNYTDINYTDFSDTNLSIHPEMDVDKMWNAYKEIICENVDYQILQQTYRQEEVDEIVELMTEVMASQKKVIYINGEPVPANVVKGRFMKIQYTHIQYVFECLKNNTTKVRNIRQYLMTVLYNAPATISHYYQAEVNHDMWGGD